MLYFLPSPRLKEVIVSPSLFTGRSKSSAVRRSKPMGLGGVGLLFTLLNHHAVPSAEYYGVFVQRPEVRHSVWYSQ